MLYLKEMAWKFLSEPQTITLLVLIGLDLLLGVAASLRTGAFDWKALPRFWLTLVLPYFVTYMGAWVLVYLGLAEYLPPAFVEVLKVGLLTPATLALLARIVVNLKDLGYPTAPAK